MKGIEGVFDNRQPQESKSFRQEIASIEKKIQQECAKNSLAFLERIEEHYISMLFLLIAWRQISLRLVRRP